MALFFMDPGQQIAVMTAVCGQLTNGKIKPPCRLDWCGDKEKRDFGSDTGKTSLFDSGEVSVCLSGKSLSMFVTYQQLI